jgi:predicted nucleic acid-binding Zn ribbon protein
MERASRFIGKMKFPDDSITIGELVCAAWSAAVGARIAKHARAEQLVRTKLIVRVDDMVWQRNLAGMSGMILSNLVEKLGEGLVDDVEFRVAPRRRGPQSAEHSQPAAPAAADDEASSIDDPNMRRLYVSSRKREMA